MDFSFTDEQRMLRDSLSSFLADAYDFDARKKAIAAAPGWRPDIWRALAQDLGVLGASLPEKLGGLGGGPVDTLVVMEELGKALVIEPYLETVVIAAGLLKRIDTPAAAQAVGEIIAGERLVVLAWGEPKGRYDANDVSTRARRDRAGWRLDGRKAVVTAAPMADQLIVTARTSGEQRDTQGVSLFLIDKSAPGVTTRDYVTVDGRQACEIALDGVSLSADALLGEEGAGLALVEQVLDEARAALCAEALGVMGQILSQTLAYTRQRRQFGQSISEFQVLQHRMVDMFIQHEQAISMTYMATLKLDQPAHDRAKAVSAAKAFVGKACGFMIESELGSVDWHLARYQGL
jgi:alkylation response protein AidB-like acyl-CoA dehydrogenase